MGLWFLIEINLFDLRFYGLVGNIVSDVRPSSKEMKDSIGKRNDRRDRKLPIHHVPVASTYA